jgi:hypothetical protein
LSEHEAIMGKGNTPAPDEDQWGGLEETQAKSLEAVEVDDITRLYMSEMAQSCTSSDPLAQTDGF